MAKPKVISLLHTDKMNNLFLNVPTLGPKMFESPTTTSSLFWRLNATQSLFSDVKNPYTDIPNLSIYFFRNLFQDSFMTDMMKGLSRHYLRTNSNKIYLIPHLFGLIFLH